MACIDFLVASESFCDGLSMSHVDNEKWEPNTGNLGISLPKITVIHRLHCLLPSCMFSMSVLSISEDICHMRSRFCCSLSLPHSTAGCIFAPLPVFFLHTTQSLLCWTSRPTRFSDQLHPEQMTSFHRVRCFAATAELQLAVCVYVALTLMFSW